MRSWYRVGRTARLGERGESFLFLQPVEIDYLQDLEKHGVSLIEYPLLKLLDNFPLYGQMKHLKKSIFIDSHPWVLCLQKALESFIMSKVILIVDLVEFSACADCVLSDWIIVEKIEFYHFNPILNWKKCHQIFTLESLSLDLPS